MLAFHPFSKGELNKRVGNVLGSIHGGIITGSRHGERLERGRRCKGIANNHFLFEDSPFLTIRRRGPSPTRSNQNFELLYISLRENLMNLIKVFRRMKCKHNYYLLRKAYGDERIHGLYLSTWKCKECGKLRFSTWVDRS
ncbi:hypothetical protein [Escherichia phage vB-EcoP-XT18]|uniref:Uncharacterized protein n=1 Tax=Escherichia phage vB-EcoP-XT18 TaxID=3093889 RepID=A0ABZ0S4G0_9CAUD|nr:hypothetical protein [Escherichia phage vB-EcoP-XT18]